GYRLSTVRNAGMKLSTGNILIFLDADIIPQEKIFFIEILRKHYEEDNILLVHGIYDFNTKNLIGYFNKDEPWKIMGGGSCSVKKKTALKIGLFDENYNGEWGYEDTDWAYRAFSEKIRIIYDKDIKSYHMPHVMVNYGSLNNYKYFIEKHGIKN
ncbi:MAG: glycosyltransferase family 2 protein, partial [Atribacterota bacterium]